MPDQQATDRSGVDPVDVPFDGQSPPSVSVVLSVYNSEAYLAEAVDSILQQTFTDFEFIIIDDGSADGSSAILDRFARSDARIRLIRRENRGLTVSLNEGLGLARGDLIARMDADDVAEPERFAKQVGFMRAHPEVSAVGCAVRMLDGAGERGAVLRFPVDHGRIEARLWRGDGGVICHPALMARRSAMQGIGGYNAEYRTAQDLDLYLRLGEAGRLSNLDDVLLHYRRHPEAVGVSKFEQQDRDVWRMLNAALSRRGVRRPKGFFEARWDHRRVMATRLSLAGNYFAACRQAFVAFTWRPWAPRSGMTLLLSLCGRSVTRAWINRKGEHRDES